MTTRNADDHPNRPEEPDTHELWEAEVTRTGRTLEMGIEGRNVYVTCIRDESGERVEEVFINIGRATPEERVAADIIGRLLSMGLRHGASVTELIGYLSGHSDGTAALDVQEGYSRTPWEAVARALATELDAPPQQP